MPTNKKPKKPKDEPPKDEPPKDEPPTPDVLKMYHLAEHYRQASILLTDQARAGLWGCSAPHLLVDSFAVELYLKCLYVQDTSKVPLREHDLEKLFEALKPETKTIIRQTFKRNVESDHVLSNLRHFNPGAVKVTDFNLSLAAAKDTFDKRRYLYEEVKDEWFYADLLREAIRTVVRMDVLNIRDQVPPEADPKGDCQE